MEVELEKRGRVAFIHLNNAQYKNVLTAETIQQFMQALDEAETYVPACHSTSLSRASMYTQIIVLYPSMRRYTDVTCLVTTGVGKVYSAGLDIGTNSSSTHIWNKIASDMGMLLKLLARLLVFPMPTVAAMNGILLHIPCSYVAGWLLLAWCACVLVHVM